MLKNLICTALHEIQYVRRLSATFDEMEKAKQAAEDINRRLSSSSSSCSSEGSHENVFENDPVSDSNAENNGNNAGKENNCLHPDDLLELGAEGKKTFNYWYHSPEHFYNWEFDIIHKCVVFLCLNSAVILDKL